MREFSLVLALAMSSPIQNDAMSQAADAIIDGERLYNVCQTGLRQGAQSVDYSSCISYIYGVIDTQYLNTAAQTGPEILCLPAGAQPEDLIGAVVAGIRDSWAERSAGASSHVLGALLEIYRCDEIVEEEK